jgi:hypothetical protein
MFFNKHLFSHLKKKSCGIRTVSVIYACGGGVGLVVWERLLLPAKTWGWTKTESQEWVARWVTKNTISMFWHESSPHWKWFDDTFQKQMRFRAVFTLLFNSVRQKQGPYEMAGLPDFLHIVKSGQNKQHKSLQLFLNESFHQ